MSTIRQGGMVADQRCGDGTAGQRRTAATTKDGSAMVPLTYLWIAQPVHHVRVEGAAAAVVAANAAVSPYHVREEGAAAAVAAVVTTVIWGLLSAPRPRTSPGGGGGGGGGGGQWYRSHTFGLLGPYTMCVRKARRQRWWRRTRRSARTPCA